MQLPSRKSVNILCEIFVRTYESGLLSINDRYLLRTVLLEDSLDEEGQRIVNRILHAVHRNWIKLGYQSAVNYCDRQDSANWRQLAKSRANDGRIFSTRVFQMLPAYAGSIRLGE